MVTVVAVAVLLPWLLLMLLPWSRLALRSLVLAPLPLLLLALVGDGVLHAPALLLGVQVGVDDGNRALLLLAGVGWSLGGAYAAASIGERPRLFCAAWLITLAGQATALLAQELATFYAGYATMSLAAYVLVVHAGSAEAWRAGRIYLLLALAAEMAILAGLLILGAALGNVRFEALEPDITTGLGAAPWLLLIGFSVKLGIVPLHMWLPLAHPVAPVPASAVLSGVIVKAGLLGLVRLLPAGTLPATQALLAIGLATAAFGALVGLTQTRLKTVLAYSTVSQMGLVMAGFAALQAGHDAAIAIAALGVFALHHGLNKLALFIAAGHRLHSRLAQALFLLPALALAGLPLTAGALAKDALKLTFDAAELGGWQWGLSLSSALTTALLLHAYRLGSAATHGRDRPHWAWIAAVIAGIALPWLWMPALTLDLAALWGGMWPLLLGVGLYEAGRRWIAQPPRLPEGDLVVLGERLFAYEAAQLRRHVRRWRDWQPEPPDVLPGRARLARLEQALLRLPAAGIGLLGVLLALWLLL